MNSGARSLKGFENGPRQTAVLPARRFFRGSRTVISQGQVSTCPITDIGRGFYGNESSPDMRLRKIGSLRGALRMSESARCGTQSALRSEAAQLKCQRLHRIMGSGTCRLSGATSILSTLWRTRRRCRPHQAASRQFGIVLGQIELATALHITSLQRQTT